MRLFVLFVVVLLGACSADEPQQAPQQQNYRIDVDRVTVSGISSGAYMAGQVHVALSGLFGGVGLIAGGPYRCAQASMQTALGVCMKGGDVGMSTLLSYANEMQSAGTIDALENLADDEVWLFHGAKDDIVVDELTRAAAKFYTNAAATVSVTAVMDQPFIHSFPTLDTGVPCGEFAPPYLMACDYDTAGQLLETLYGVLEPRTVANGELLSVLQPGADDAEMLDAAFLYVPSACASGDTCGLHVVLHGCRQSSEFLGDAFAAGAGFNEWAESNRLLVLYPQVAKSTVAPLNPQGCWDWWGYTGDDYATRDAAQIRVIKATIDALADAPL